MSSITVNVTDREGARTEGVEWKSHESLMEALTRHKFPILATCGGNASCSTCHCYLDGAFETTQENSPSGMRRRTCWTCSTTPATTTPA